MEPFRHDFQRGATDAVPVMVGYFPIAVGFGVLAVQNQLSTLDALLMSLLVFAGAAQFVAIGLIAAGVDPLQIVLGIFFLNLRHLIMVLSLRNRFGQQPDRLLKLSALLVTDETFSLAATRQAIRVPAAYLLGVGLGAYSAWVAGSGVGAWFAAGIPASLASLFGIGLYAMFIALLVPQIRRSLPAALAAAIAMLVSSLTQPLLGTGWGIVLATIAGAVVGGLLAREKAA
jgi:4-azaleucine resistance transporter AzlC